MSHNKPETLAQDPAALAAGLPAKYAAARKAANDLARSLRMEQVRPEAFASGPARLRCVLKPAGGIHQLTRAEREQAQAGRLIHQNGIYYAVTKPEIVTGSGEALSITADHWHFIRGTENEA